MGSTRAVRRGDGVVVPVRRPGAEPGAAADGAPGVPGGAGGAGAAAPGPSGAPPDPDDLLAGARAGARAAHRVVDRAARRAAERVLAAAEGPAADLGRRARRTADVLGRRVTGDYEVDELGFDRELTEEVLLDLLRPLYRRWFRVELRGGERVPRGTGALLVANHSGTIGIDALMTMVAVHDDVPGGRHLRVLAADLVLAAPVLGDLARRAGITLATPADAERLLADGELVGVWPEGYKGVGKHFRDRYRLQRFGRGGFVASALRAGVPIVPCAIVGAEEVYPKIGDIAPLARLLGLPYVPVTPFFPLLGPLGLVPLPSRWVVELGEPVRTDLAPAGTADDPAAVLDLADQVRETIQETLHDLLLHRGSVFR